MRSLGRRQHVHDAEHGPDLRPLQRVVVLPARRELPPDPPDSALTVSASLLGWLGENIGVPIITGAVAGIVVVVTLRLLARER